MIRPLIFSVIIFVIGLIIATHPKMPFGGSFGIAVIAGLICFFVTYRFGTFSP